MPKEEKETQSPKTEEEKTSKNPDEGEETPKNDSLEKENKSLRARMEHHKNKQKEFEERAKELEKKLEQMGGDSSSQSDGPLSDVDKFVEMKRATEGLNSDEIEELKKRAKADNTSLAEARENENFELWLEAKRQKVAQESKVPKPSTKQSLEGKSLSEIDVSELKNLDPEDRARVLEEKGIFKKGEFTRLRSKEK